MTLFCKLLIRLIPLLLLGEYVCSFTISSFIQTHETKRTLPLFALPDIADMKPREIRKELESYGISTKSFLEKSELVDALQQARANGASARTKTTTKERASVRTEGINGKDDASRLEKIKEQMEKAARMKVQELKKELHSRGVSTKSFFEKSEFVRAYAEAVVDNKQPSSNTTKEEKYDPSYKDVIMQKMNARDPLVLQGAIIDIKV